MRLTLAAVLVAALGTVSWADAPGDCPHPPKKHHKKVSHRKPVPPPKVDCHCVGEQGPPGPRGPKGDDGVTVTRVVNEYHEFKTFEVRPARAPMRLRAGVMGTAQAPHGDWAWGPALEVSSDLSDRYELAFAGALADGVSHDREDGYILRLGVVRHMDSKIGFAAGVQFTSIDGSPSNGEIDGSYLGGYVSAVYTPVSFLRIEFGPTLGGLRDDFERGTQLAFGAQGSAFLGWGW